MKNNMKKNMENDVGNHMDNNTENNVENNVETNKAKYTRTAEVKSLFCYGDEKIKKMIWKLKTDSNFCESEEGKGLIMTLSKEIQQNLDSTIPDNMDTDSKVENKAENKVEKKVEKNINKTHINKMRLIIVCIPSSSYWQSNKNFDHMHMFINKLSKSLEKKVRYIPWAIIPKLNKQTQKKLNKKDRQDQSLGAYKLSNYFKYYLKNILKKNTADLKVLVLDDVKTTGSTIIECIRVLEAYVKSLSDKGIALNINGLTIAYEA